MHRFIVYSLKSVVIVTECISDRNDTNKRNSCLNLILFNEVFLGRYGHGDGGLRGGHKMLSTLKISKTKNDLSMKLSPQKHVSFISIVFLFSSFPVWLVSSEATMTLFLWQPPVNYVNSIYNRTCLTKTICNCLHWCNLCIRSQ